MPPDMDDSDFATSPNATDRKGFGKNIRPKPTADQIFADSTYQNRMIQGMYMNNEISLMDNPVYRRSEQKKEAEYGKRVQIASRI